MLARRALLGGITALMAVAPTLPAAASSEAKADTVKTVSPKRWAAGVCPQLADFIDAYQEISASVAGASSPAEVQSTLVDSIDDAAAAVRDLVAAIRDAGTPDVTKGKRVVATLITQFKQVRTTLHAAAGQVEDLSIDDPQQFSTDLTAVEQQTDAKISASLQRLNAIDPKLQKALRANAECTAV